MRRPTLALLAATGLLAAGLGVSIVAGATDRGAPVPDQANPPPPTHLADTGLYTDAGLTTIHPDCAPFAPQYPLWTDGATKRRWIRMPPGTAIDASAIDAWEFPPGTRLWKEFSFAGRHVETRYMERLADGRWSYATYRWADEGRDAVLAPNEGVASATDLGGGVAHAIPSAADCLACHATGPSPVLGFSALQLSPDRDPGALHQEQRPPNAIDLRALVVRRMISGIDPILMREPPRIAARTPTERAALGYLHGNCGGCHRDDGALAGLGMSLAHAIEAGETNSALRTTFGHPSRFALPGAPGRPALRIDPGAPDRSVLVARMRSRDPRVQMPPLGSVLVDEDAVALIERWIEHQPQENSR